MIAPQKEQNAGDLRAFHPFFIFYTKKYLLDLEEPIECQLQHEFFSLESV